MSKFEKMHNQIRDMWTVKSIKQSNVHIMCTISCRFCALFGIGSFIEIMITRKAVIIHLNSRCRKNRSDDKVCEITQNNRIDLIFRV